MPPSHARDPNLAPFLQRAIALLLYGVLATLHRYAAFSPVMQGREDHLQVILGLFVLFCEFIYTVTMMVQLSGEDHMDVSSLWCLVHGCTALLFGVNVFLSFSDTITWLTISAAVYTFFWSGFFFELIICPIQIILMEAAKLAEEVRATVAAGMAIRGHGKEQSE
ncbi:hypothetical protein PG985_010542 [Apiospora marii]|uniref:Transmembrane protein 107 n=1 Tax=Apiospora marii TaxID=335849 RepID=A0ABR1T356_9PEZI